MCRYVQKGRRGKDQRSLLLVTAAEIMSERRTNRLREQPLHNQWTAQEQGWRTRMVAKSEPPVALRTIMYYLLLRHITISVLKKKNKKKKTRLMWWRRGRKKRNMEPLERSSKKLVPSIEECVEESGKQNNQLPVPSSEQSHQIEQKRVEAVDINGSILSCHFVWYPASSSMKW